MSMAWLSTIVRLLPPRGLGGLTPPRSCLALDQLEDRLTPAASISVGNATFTLDSGSTSVVVTRTGDLSQQVTIAYSITDGTAIDGTNYEADPITGTLLFGSGVVAAAIPVDVLPTNFPEATRTFSVDLTGIVDVQGPPASFAAKQGFATGTGAYSVVSADVNGDGKVDLVIANRGSNTVSVLLNKTTPGATSSSFGAQTTFATGLQPTSVAVADVNGDGKADLVVTNNASNTVSVLLNKTTPGAATPSFAAQRVFATGLNPAAVSVADVNGDGKADLLVANFGSNNVSVLQNTTTPGAAIPSFAAQRLFGAGSRPAAIATADVNGDGKADLLVANRWSNSVSVLVNTTSPGSTPAFAKQKMFVTGTNPVAVSAADVNGDGRADLLVANNGSNTVSVLLNTTNAGAGTPSFAAQQTFATGSNPAGVTATDANSDGKLDLVVTNCGSKSVWVLVNTTTPGAGSLAFATQAALAVGNKPMAVTTTDINGDGRLDLVVANNASKTVTVQLNTTGHTEATSIGVPAPLFPEVARLPTGREPNALAWSDVNGDGKADLIASNFGSNTVSVLLNTTTPGAATPTFAPHKTFATGVRPFSVSAADVNGDGKADLVVANVASNTVSVLLNTTAPGAATPSFAAQRTFTIGSGPEAVLLTDVNGDGKVDVVVANNGSDTVSVLLNTTTPGAATPTFATQQSFATGVNPASLAGADVNGDGKPDLIVANFTSNTISVLLNTTAPGAATPTFTAQRVFSVGGQPASVAAADVNGDGRADLLVANRASNSVSVLLNTTSPGSATPAFASQRVFAAGSNPVAVSASDVNGDGKADLLVANFGSNTVSVLLNKTTPGSATPTFATQQAFATGTNPVWVQPADMNADGRPDLLVANRGASGVSVLLNTPVLLGNGSTVTLVAAPVVNGIAIVGPDRTTASSGTFLVTFSKPVFGVTASNFTLWGTAVEGASIGVPTSSDGGRTWSVPVAFATDGTLGITLSNRAGIRDSNGNLLYNSTSDDGSLFTPVVGPWFTIDRNSPTIQISPPSRAATQHDSVTFTITYADANFNASTLTAADITLNSTGTATGTISVDEGTGTTRTVTISNITGDGTLSISVLANTANDTFGRQAPAAGPSESFIVDNTPPSIVIVPTSGPITTGAPIVFLITYSDANFNASTLTAADVVMNVTGSAAGTVTVDEGTGNTRTVTIENVTGFGTIGISLAANTADDLAGNLALAAGPSMTVKVMQGSPP